VIVTGYCELYRNSYRNISTTTPRSSQDLIAEKICHSIRPPCLRVRSSRYPRWCLIPFRFRNRSRVDYSQSSMQTPSKGAIKTYQRASNFGVCWISLKPSDLRPTSLKTALMTCESSLRTSAGWLHSFRRYCNDWKTCCWSPLLVACAD
jgi:hypothetical protein